MRPETGDRVGGSGATRHPEEPEDEVVPPVWFELVPVAAASLVASVGLVGLVLGILGVFHTAIALVGGLPVAAGGVVAVQRSLSGRGQRTGRASSAALGGAVAASVLAAAFLVIAAWAPSQHVLVNRDPGSYTATARWLSRDGSLEVQAATGGFSPEHPVTFGSFAVRDTGGGALQFQFNHLTSTVLAVGHDVGGHRLLFRLPAFAASAGLLAVYALAVRVTGRPWAALVAPAALGAAMPFLYVARDTFSEPFAMLLLWSAVLVGVIAARAERRGSAVTAGLLLGAGVATRIDALLHVAIALPLVAGWVAAAGAGGVRERLRVAGWGLAATVPGVVVGVVDLQARSGGYAARHAEQVGLLGVLVAASFAASVAGVLVAVRSPTVPDRLRSILRTAALPLAGAAMAALVAGWLLRPHLQVMRGRDVVPLVGALQARAGVPVDASRRYGELSLEWASWYLGPLGLALAIVGVGLAVHLTARGRANGSTVAAVVVVAVSGALYWWRPTIVPDHVWAMRRFVPAVLPGLALMASLTVASIAGVGVLRPVPRRALAVVAGLAVVVGAGVVTWPVRELREQHGYLGVVEEACELIGDDASVVVVGATAGNVLPQSLRSWCGVPVAVLSPDAPATAVERMSDDVRAAGRTPTWVAMTAEELEPFSSGGIDVRTHVAVEERRPERTLLEPPAAYEPPGTGWSLHVRRDAP
jgi:hypothetical protein